MILNKQESEVIRKGEIQENTVGIDVNNIGFITQLLTSNLYKNPLGSFLRETVANGIDSTKEAGKDLPVLIIIDYNEVKKVKISIRDYGTGLSPERFDKIYKNIGSSTKRDSNDYIGALGIGRFSCLAVADQVTLVSYYNGTRYEYLMYKDNGYINIDLVDEIDTAEENGFMVSIEYDDYMFHSNLYNNLVWLQLLNVQIVANVSNPTVQTVVNSINKKLYYEYNNFYTIKHSIGYTIEMGNVIYQYKDIIKESVGNNIVLKCDMGSLQLTPSREALINNEHNKQIIKEAIDKANIEILELFNKSIKSEYSIDEYIVKIRRGCFNIDDNANCYVFNGISYDEAIKNKIFIVNGIKTNNSINNIFQKSYHRQFLNKDIYKVINCCFSIRNAIENGIKLFYKTENRLLKKTIDYYLSKYTKIVILNYDDIVFIERTFNCNEDDLKTILISLCGMTEIKNSDVPKDFTSSSKKENKSETIKIIEQTEYYSKQTTVNIQDFYDVFNSRKGIICIFVPLGDKGMIDFLKPLLISTRVRIYEIKRNVYDNIKENNNIIKANSILVTRNRYFAKLFETYIIQGYFKSNQLYANEYHLISEFKKERKIILKNIKSSTSCDGIIEYYKTKKWINEDYINYFHITKEDKEYINNYEDLCENRIMCNEIIKEYFIKQHGLNKKIFNLKSLI